MPCRCEYDAVDDQKAQLRSAVKEIKSLADAATRAACDMRTIMRKHYPGMECYLTPETRNWIAKHDQEDAKRIREENAAGIRQKVKQQALDKLTLEERRVLGL